MRHIDEVNGTNIVEVGVDLSEFYTSVEWDILEVPAVRSVIKTIHLGLFEEMFKLIIFNFRNEKFYTCCDEPYLDM